MEGHLVIVNRIKCGLGRYIPENCRSYRLALYSGKYMNNVYHVVNKNLNALKVINMKHTFSLLLIRVLIAYSFTKHSKCVDLVVYSK